jgi:cobalamin-dependent methionine synthase I
MGYLPGTAPEPVTTLIEEITEELMLPDEVRAEYRIFDDIRLIDSDRTLIIEDIVFDVRSIIYSQIKTAEKAALFICTAGPAVGEKSRESMKNGDLLRGYVYDVIGSEVVEAAADMMQENLRASVATRGMNITNRFSPGYCRWDVAEQHKLFGFFKDNFCGITLTASALMHPIKSISGLIGIGKDVRFAPYQCKLCDDKSCIYRNRKP